LFAISSCAKRSHPFVISKGVKINDASTFVDVVTIDSLSFASGNNLWTLQGLIVSEGSEYPFYCVYTENPKEKVTRAVQAVPPQCLNALEEDAVSTILTLHGTEVRISWKTKDRFLMIYTTLNPLSK